VHVNIRGHNSTPMVVEWEVDEVGERGRVEDEEMLGRQRVVLEALEDRWRRQGGGASAVGDIGRRTWHGAQLLGCLPVVSPFV